jgi:hypothetical protein
VIAGLPTQPAPSVVPTPSSTTTSIQDPWLYDRGRRVRAGTERFGWARRDRRSESGSRSQHADAGTAPAEFPA